MRKLSNLLLAIDVGGGGSLKKNPFRLDTALPGPSVPA